MGTCGIVDAQPITLLSRLRYKINRATREYDGSNLLIHQALRNEDAHN